MRFKEVVSPLKEARLWGCVYKGYSFVIMLEETMGKGFEEWTGYSATYSKKGNKQIHPIGSIVSTFNEAVELCKNKIKQLINN